MEKVRYEEMLPHEIVSRRKSFPAAFIGLGGLEWHSEHLAVGNDALKAEKLCELAAARSGGFAFPTLWYGEPRTVGLMEANAADCDEIQRKMDFDRAKFALDFFGTSGQEQVEFYQKLLHHVLIQMKTLEMRAVCILCGHYPIETWSGPVVARFNERHAPPRVFAANEKAYCPQDDRVGADHAARWETSYLWYLRPECCDLSVYRDRRDESLVGVGGEDPREEAAKEVGRIGCELIVEGMVRKARELLPEAE